MENLAYLHKENSQDLLRSLQESLSQYLLGKEQIVELALAGFFAGGHVLLEGAPGSGKTSLAQGMAKLFAGSFRRVQMTSDLLPSDIVGVLRLLPAEKEFQFRKGPIFCNILLADELNRTSPKTQSALFEAMAEGTVTVDGVSYALPDPFFVVATQNPYEFHGVYPLAESQLDRFMMQLLLTTPETEDELLIYKNFLKKTAIKANTFLNSTQVLATRREIENVYIEETVLRYCYELAAATRVHPKLSYGVSVRAVLQLLSASRALAFLRQRKFVIPQDVKDLAVAVFAHRLCFPDGEHSTSERQEILTEILQSTPAPK